MGPEIDSNHIPQCQNCCTNTSSYSQARQCRLPAPTDGRNARSPETACHTNPRLGEGITPQKWISLTGSIKWLVMMMWMLQRAHNWRRSDYRRIIEKPTFACPCQFNANCQCISAHLHPTPTTQSHRNEHYPSYLQPHKHQNPKPQDAKFQRSKVPPELATQPLPHSVLCDCICIYAVVQSLQSHKTCKEPKAVLTDLIITKCLCQLQKISHNAKWTCDSVCL